MAIMEPDDRICYCFHVSLRKLVNYARRERPRAASQLSDCLGAGTGCGWCIPILEKIHKEVREHPEPADASIPEGLPESAAEYEAARGQYLKSDTKHSF